MGCEWVNKNELTVDGWSFIYMVMNLHGFINAGHLWLSKLQATEHGRYFILKLVILIKGNLCNVPECPACTLRTNEYVHQNMPTAQKKRYQQSTIPIPAVLLTYCECIE